MTRKNQSEAPAAGILAETPAEVFRELVGEAVARQGVRASEHASFYLVNLLTDFIHTRRLFPAGIEGGPTLVELLAGALESGPAVRLAAFRRMGDFALFVSGFFSDSLNRKLVDVDYYAAMGGGAYAHASRLAAGFGSGEIFEELSREFVAFMDVMAEVGERSQIAGSNRGLLRHYETYVRTGSERARRKLEESGVLPVRSLDTRYRQ
jgi:hypothetical protein